MKNKKVLWALPLLLLAACGHAPQMGPMAYDFTITRVEDARPDDDSKLMASDPFTAEKLIAAWQRAVARLTFGATPGQLAMRVTQYEATHSGVTYTLSMAADMVAKAGDPVPSYRPEAKPIVAQASASCVAYGRSTGGAGGVAVAKAVFGANAPQGGQQNSVKGPSSLTPAARNATLWQELWTQCTTQLATQLGNSLLAESPRLLPDTRGR
jgi:hypothetical protein